MRAVPLTLLGLALLPFLLLPLCPLWPPRSLWDEQHTRTANVTRTAAPPTTGTRILRGCDAPTGTKPVFMSPVLSAWETRSTMIQPSGALSGMSPGLDPTTHAGHSPAVGHILHRRKSTDVPATRSVSPTTTLNSPSSSAWKANATSYMAMVSSNASTTATNERCVMRDEYGGVYEK